MNYLVRLGWSHGDAEVFSKDDLLKWFDLERVRVPGAVQPGEARLDQPAVPQERRPMRASPRWSSPSCASAARSRAPVRRSSGWFTW